MNRTQQGTGRDAYDLTIYINDETYPKDDIMYNDPEFVTYTHFRTGQVFVSLNDDGAGECTYRVEDIDSLIEALTDVKAHHERVSKMEKP